MLTNEQYDILKQFKKRSSISARDVAVLLNNKNGLDYYAKNILELKELGCIERSSVFIDLDQDDEIEYMITDFGNKEYSKYTTSFILKIIWSLFTMTITAYLATQIPSC